MFPRILCITQQTAPFTYINTADYGEDLHAQIHLWKTVKGIIHKVDIKGLACPW